MNFKKILVFLNEHNLKEIVYNYSKRSVFKEKSKFINLNASTDIKRSLLSSIDPALVREQRPCEGKNFLKKFKYDL